jgi:hypothetical protein
VSADPARRVAALAVLVIAVAVAGCGFLAPETEILDGWSIGSQVGDCRSERPLIRSCEELVALARESVGADAETSGMVFHEGGYRNAAGEQILSNRSGGRQLVVVLQNAAGERRAVGVFCGLTDCLARGEPAYRP